MSEITPEQTEQVVVLLLDSASPSELPKIVSAAVRADLMWRCQDCKQPNYPTRERCGECRTPRSVTP